MINGSLQIIFTPSTSRFSAPVITIFAESSHQSSQNHSNCLITSFFSNSNSFSSVSSENFPQFASYLYLTFLSHFAYIVVSPSIKSFHTLNSTNFPSDISLYHQAKVYPALVGFSIVVFSISYHVQYIVTFAVSHPFFSIIILSHWKLNQYQ
jgi:hypothetical protein